MRYNLLTTVVLVITASLPLAYAQTDVNLAQGLEPYKSYMGGNIDTVSLTTVT